MTRACPCGARLERKPNESQAQYQKRRHCNGKCRGKYHRPPVARRGFGLEVPSNKEKNRTGPGLHAYITSRVV